MTEKIENRTLSFNGELKLVEGDNGQWYIRDRRTDKLSGPLNLDELILGGTSVVDLAGTNLSVDSNGILHASFDDTDTTRTDEEIEDVVDGLLVAGPNVSLSYDDANNMLHIEATDTDTQPVASGETAAVSGDGTATTFTLPHSLGSSPTSVSVQPMSVDGSADFYVSKKTSSAVEVTYETAPPSGTDNLTYDLILVE